MSHPKSNPAMFTPAYLVPPDTGGGVGEATVLVDVLAVVDGFLVTVVSVVFAVVFAVVLAVVAGTDVATMEVEAMDLPGQQPNIHHLGSMTNLHQANIENNKGSKLNNDSRTHKSWHLSSQYPHLMLSDYVRISRVRIYHVHCP